MAVTEQQRHRLLAWFEEQMGPDLGATMMELLPPGDTSQLATHTDLADLRAAFAELRAEMKTDTLQLQRTFITWLLATQGAVITSIGIATGLVLGFG